MVTFLSLIRSVYIILTFIYTAGRIVLTHDYPKLCQALTSHINLMPGDNYKDGAFIDALQTYIMPIDDLLTYDQIVTVSIWSALLNYYLYNI